MLRKNSLVNAYFSSKYFGLSFFERCSFLCSLNRICTRRNKVSCSKLKNMSMMPQPIVIRIMETNLLVKLWLGVRLVSFWVLLSLFTFCHDFRKTAQEPQVPHKKKVVGHNICYHSIRIRFQHCEAALRALRSEIIERRRKVHLRNEQEVSSRWVFEENVNFSGFLLFLKELEFVRI